VDGYFVWLPAEGQKRSVRGSHTCPVGHGGLKNLPLTGLKPLLCLELVDLLAGEKVGRKLAASRSARRVFFKLGFPSLERSRIRKVIGLKVYSLFQKK
jgi:hypothetical protein